MQCLIYTVYYIYYILIENRFSNIILSQGKNCFKSRPRKLLYPQVFHPIESQALRSYPKPWTKISNPITLSFPNQFQMIYKPSTWTSMQIPIVAPPTKFSHPEALQMKLQIKLQGHVFGEMCVFFRQRARHATNFCLWQPHKSSTDDTLCRQLQSAHRMDCSCSNESSLFQFWVRFAVEKCCKLWLDEGAAGLWNESKDKTEMGEKVGGKTFRVAANCILQWETPATDVAVTQRAKQEPYKINF